MKKPGLLKRIFSFGRKQSAQEPEHAEENTYAIEAPVVVPELNEEDLKVVDQQPVEAVVEPEDIPPEEEPDETEFDSAPELMSEPKSVEPDTPTSLDLLSDLTADQGGNTTLEHVVSSSIEGIAETSSKLESSPDEEMPDDDASDEVVTTDIKPDPHIVTKTDETSAVAQTLEEPEKRSWFKRLSQGLARSSTQLSENISAVFTKKKLDDAALEDLEDILLQADLGVDTAMKIVDSLAKQRMGKDVSEEEVRGIMAEEIEKVLKPVARPLELDLDHKPHVILVVGVNGSGKTTTIGKLSQKLNQSGYSTMLVAGDTFRAAAIEQLTIWGERTGSPVISKPLGSDSSGLAFDAWQKAKDQGSDVLMMDTAGRLQNRSELMAELEKIIRVLKKKDPDAPHTVLLTLDATTGQNALNQVEIFGKVAGVNGLIMTKLDGSARGGILVAISSKFELPVYFLGVGEQVEDLEPFEARDFARSIAGLNA